MLISRVAIRRPIFIAMVMAALVLFGWVCLRTLGVDLFPRVEFPIITITTRLPGTDPETMETSVTDPIEEAVNTVAGIRHLRSVSSDSVSQVIVEFVLEKPIDAAYQEIQSKLRAIRAELPDDIDEPVIDKLDIDAAPVLTVVLSGDMGAKELSRLADTVVKARLQRVPNVGSVRLVGFRDRKMWLWLDPMKLLRHNLTVMDVKNALVKEHIELPGGRVETGPLELAVKTKAEFVTAEDFNRMIVARTPQGIVRLGDVGTAEDGMEELRSYAQLDERPGISLLVRRQSGTNTVEVVQAVKREVEALRTELAPRGVRLETAQDQSRFIQHSVDEVKFHLLAGGGLAVLVVLLFLHNFRSTFISALVLPTSVMATFMLMSAFGFTLNMMTLLGLSLAIGLLIDDAIVVQENIMRHVQLGKPPAEAAYFATSEIGLAVIATTLSVVAVFLPVAFTPGLIGRFFFPFAMTIAAAVLISMFVSFTLDPMLSSRLLRRTATLPWYFQPFEKAFAALEHLYAALLRVGLRHRWKVLFLSLCIFALSIRASAGLKSEFVPNEDQDEFQILVRAPQGSSLERTREILERLRAKVRSDLQPGELGFTFYAIGADELQRVNEASLYVKLAPKAARTRSQGEIMAGLRAELNTVKEAVVSVQYIQAISGGRTQEIQLEVRGQDLDRIHGLAQQIAEKMRAAGGYADIDLTHQTGKPQMDVLIKRDRAADLRVDPAVLGDTVRASIGGLDVAKFKSEGDRFDVAIRFLEEYRTRPEQIAAVWVPTAGGGPVSLSTIAAVERTDTPVEINRYARQRQITVLANLNGKTLGDAVPEMERFVKDVSLPPGYIFGWTGPAADMQESFGNLLFTMLLSVLVIYMVLAAQFESLVHPFTIMLTLPLALAGSLLALALTGMTVNIFSMMAFIFLLGLVTKNAILLIDYANTLRDRDGLARDDALRTAGPARLRPILMTTVAMIAGMAPIAIGGNESRAPMAVAIIGGLISSTLLTLLVVPAAYSLLDQFSTSVRRLTARLLGSPTPATRESARLRAEAPGSGE